MKSALRQEFAVRRRLAIPYFCFCSISDTYRTVWINLIGEQIS